LPRAILTAPSSELSLISDYIEGREQMLMSNVWFMFNAKWYGTSLSLIKKGKQVFDLCKDEIQRLLY